MTGQSVGRVSPQGVTRRGLASDIHDLGEEPEAHAPVAFGGVALDGGGFLVDADDGADALLQVLESLPGVQEKVEGQVLIPVQYVARDSGETGEGTGHQPRTLWGRIAHGRVKAGDRVQLFPSGQLATVAEVRLAGAVVDVVEAGQSAGIVLDRQLDVSRGDWIATPQGIQAAQRFSATLAWLDSEPAVIGRKYWVRHGNRWVQARISAIDHRLDIHTLEETDAHELAVNDIGRPDGGYRYLAGTLDITEISFGEGAWEGVTHIVRPVTRLRATVVLFTPDAGVITGALSIG